MLSLSRVLLLVIALTVAFTMSNGATGTVECRDTSNNEILDFYSGPLQPGSIIRLSSPMNSQTPRFYRTNLKCTWNITAKSPSWKGAFYIAGLQLDPPEANCDPTTGDRISITKTYNNDNHHLYLCGDEGENTVYYTMRSQSQLEFITDSDSSNSGFWALFFEYDPNSFTGNDGDSDNHDEPILPPEEIYILQQLAVPGNSKSLCQSCIGRKYLGEESLGCTCAGEARPSCAAQPTQASS